MGKVFEKAFRILGLELTELCSFWYGLKGLFFNYAQVSGQLKLSLTIKVDDVTSGRKDVDPHGGHRRLGGKWVQ